MLITIRSRRLLRLAGWRRNAPAYVRASHGLWWRWFTKGDGQVLSSDVLLLIIGLVVLTWIL